MRRNLLFVCHPARRRRQFLLVWSLLDAGDARYNGQQRTRSAARWGQLVCPRGLMANVGLCQPLLGERHTTVCRGSCAFQQAVQIGCVSPRPDDRGSSVLCMRTCYRARHCFAVMPVSSGCNWHNFGSTTSIHHTVLEPCCLHAPCAQPNQRSVQQFMHLMVNVPTALSHVRTQHCLSQMHSSATESYKAAEDLSCVSGVKSTAACTSASLAEVHARY